MGLQISNHRGMHVSQKHRFSRDNFFVNYGGTLFTLCGCGQMVWDRVDVALEHKGQVLRDVKVEIRS